MRRNRISVEIPPSEQLKEQGIAAIRFFHLYDSQAELVGSKGEFPPEIRETTKLSLVPSEPSITFTRHQEIGVLTIAVKDSSSIVLQAVLTKGPIHRQLNLANKFLMALKTMIQAIENGQNLLTFDWLTFEKAQMNLKKARLPPNIDFALSNVLTKKPVVIVGSDYETVFGSLFILVSPINQPFYNDISWAINPPPLDFEFHFVAYSDPLLSTAQQGLNVSKRDGIAKILLEDNKCEGAFSSPLVRSVSEALATGSIETISQTLKMIFSKAKEAKSFEDLDSFIEIKRENPEDAQFLWDLATRVL